MAYPYHEDSNSDEELLEIARQEGEQTRITETVRALANEIDPDNKLHGEELVREVCSYVTSMLPEFTYLESLYEKNPDLEQDKRARTADELLSTSNLLPNRLRTRNISGCIETAHITRALLLAKGIPCVYTETLEENWCQNEAADFDPEAKDTNFMRGHVFIDAFIEEEGKWITVDPNEKGNTIREYGDYRKNGNKYIYPRSAKDSWDLGYKTNKDFQEAVVKYFKGQKESEN